MNSKLNYLQVAYKTKQYLQVFILLLLFTNSTLYGDVYRIRQGDNLLIAVIGQPEYSLSVKVREDGRISYFGGDIEVAGKTTEEIKKEIQDFLLNKEFITNPIILVSLDSQENGVFVGGAVETPGRYLISPESDIDIYRAIALAGGMTENADTQQVYLIRYKVNTDKDDKSKQSQVNSTIQDISTLVETYDLSTNQPIKDIRVNLNDLVYVTQLSVIEIQGEVKSPGKIYIHEKIKIVDALARGGGFTEEADISAIVKVSKEGTLTEFSVDEQFWKTTENSGDEKYLSDGDVLFVPNAIKVEPIYVTGYVHTAGAHKVRGPITLQKAIATAGGFEKEANKKKVHIHRSDGTTLAHHIEPGKDHVLLYPGDILEINKKFEINWGLISSVSTTVIVITSFIINLAQR